MTETEKLALQTLNCLYAQVPEEVAKDVHHKVINALDEKSRNISRLHDGLKTIAVDLIPWTSCRDAWEESDDINDQIALKIENLLHGGVE